MNFLKDFLVAPLQRTVALAKVLPIVTDFLCAVFLIHFLPICIGTPFVLFQASIDVRAPGALGMAAGFLLLDEEGLLLLVPNFVATTGGWVGGMHACARSHACVHWYAHACFARAAHNRSFPPMIG